MCTNTTTLANSREPAKSSRKEEVVEDETPAVQVAQQYFPGSLPNTMVLAKLAKVLSKGGYTPSRTLFAQSICPDEVNHESGDLPNLLAAHLGEVFHMGGLAGIPFTGKTGFAAFSHHVPEDGHCFVLMAPHVGISDSLELGKYNREGQSEAGTCCGAACAGLQHCSNSNPLPDLAECQDDYQMAYIIRELNKRKTVILQHGDDENAKQAELAKQMWMIGVNMLDRIVSTNFGGDNSKLVLFTGIQINMPGEEEDYFQPLSLEVHDKEGSVVDLLERTFA